MSDADALAGVCLHRMVELGATRIVVHDWPGYGDVLVHVPDVLAGPSALAPRLAAAFAPRHRVLSIALSDDSPYQVQADQVRRVLDQYGLRDATLVTEAFGAAAALTLAAWWPERVRAIVLVDAPDRSPCGDKIAARALREAPPDVAALRSAIACQIISSSIDTVVSDVARLR